MTDPSAALFIEMAVRLYPHYKSGIYTANLKEIADEASIRGYSCVFTDKSHMIVYMDNLSVEFTHSRTCKRFEIGGGVGYGINSNAAQLFDFLELYCERLSFNDPVLL